MTPGLQRSADRPVYDWTGKGAASRAEGTVYGAGHGERDRTRSVPAGSLENSGSLTGHILAQGWSDTPSSNRNNTKVVLIMLLVLTGMVGLGLAVVLAAGDGFNTLFDGLINR